jgi:serine/threonine-protein kinase
VGDEQPVIEIDAGEPTAASARALVGRVISQRYRVDSLIAAGGWGAVYRGEHMLMRKRIAIKVLHPSVKDLPLLVERFRREAMVGAHVSHPNIASATDFGLLDDGSHFLILEHIKGQTLHEALLVSGAMHFERAVGIARQVALALQVAHERGVIHRDVKPQNVMLVELSDNLNRTASVPAMVIGSDIVKLIDFGFARVSMDRLSLSSDDDPPPSLVNPQRITLQGEIFGTIAYLAPEAALGMDAVNERSDLYALGVMLYQMLAGRHPFDATEEGPLFRAHLKTKPPPIGVRNPTVEVLPALEAVVMRLLEKDPELRFQSAIDLVEAMDAAVGLDVGPLRPAAIPAASRLPSLSGSVNGGPLPSPARLAPPAAASGPTAPLPLPSPAAPSGAAPAPQATASATLAPPPESAPVEWPPPPSSSTPQPARKVPVSVWIGLVGVVVMGLRMAMQSGEVFVPVQPAASASASVVAPPEASSSTPEPTPVNLAESAALKTRLRAAVKIKDWGPATIALRDLCKTDPAGIADPKVLPAAMETVTSVGQRPGTDADRIFDLLENHTGSAGIDVLYEVVQLKGGSRASTRAAEALRRPGVLEKGAPAARIAFKLRDARCEDKAALLPQAVAEGDARVLQIFESMRSACGNSKTLEQASKDLVIRLSK